MAPFRQPRKADFVLHAFSDFFILKLWKWIWIKESRKSHSDGNIAGRPALCWNASETPGQGGVHASLAFMCSLLLGEEGREPSSWGVFHKIWLPFNGSYLHWCLLVDRRVVIEWLTCWPLFTGPDWIPAASNSGTAPCKFTLGCGVWCSPSPITSMFAEAPARHREPAGRL